MSGKPATVLAVGVLFSALAGCDLGETKVQGSGVSIHGLVESEAGVGVPGVQMRIGYSAADTCGTTDIHGVDGPVTDSTGKYGVVITDAGAPRIVCVKVVATPPAALPLASDSLRRNVQLTERMGADSVRFDMVLPPR